MLTLGLDIGGTKIAAALVDSVGTLVHTAVRPTPNPAPADDVWDVVHALIAEVVRAAGAPIAAVGIASAGPVDLPSGSVSPINIAGWHRFPLRDKVAAAVPATPVVLGGDGLCMALGEQWLGAGRGARFLLGMVVSTGVGGGLVLDGAPTRAAPATPVTSGTWWSNWTAGPAPAAGMAAWRRWPPGRRWCAGRAKTGGRRRRGPAPGTWPPPRPQTRWRRRRFTGRPTRSRR